MMRKIWLLISLLIFLIDVQTVEATAYQKVFDFKDLEDSTEAAAEVLAEKINHNYLIFWDKEQNQIWPITFAQAGIKAQAIALTAENGFERLFGNHYGVRLNWEREALPQMVLATTNFAEIKPTDAYFKIGYDNSVTIIPEVIGVKLDLAAITTDIEQSLSPDSPTVITLTTIKTPPAKNQSDLARLNIEGLLGEFSTRFNGGDTKRAGNIWLASTKIEEVFVMPGEEFSFNKIVGPRTKEQGFHEAGVIINNHHEKDYGGGVCQVSSTLYNAALAAKMTIIERHGHSMTVPYVEKGRDAAVVYDEKDFRFRNDTDNPILIKSYFAYGKLTIKIFGKTSP